MNELDQKLRDAVRHFWEVRERQAQRQGLRTGQRDQGARAAVTGGAQMDGFVDLVKDLIVESGMPETSVFCKSRLELPGFYRPEKQWDLLVVIDNNLLAGVEFKSQVGPSFGNNFNNRTEEALGNATDLWAAYREGAFHTSQRPWLGYLMLLEEAPQSTSPVGTREPHFPVFEDFRGASYAKRYEILLTKLVRERLYDTSCLLLSDRTEGTQGVFHEPSPDLSFQNFATSLLAKAIAYVRTHK
ncbi:Type-2 restriction enzyme PaeR7I [Candidatus Entotheonellaceae bacterium PAL068K]